MSTPLGDRIRQARLARGWTQTQLAEQMQTTKKSVGVWERGGRISPVRLGRLAKLLEIDPAGDWVETSRRFQRVTASAPEPDTAPAAPNGFSYAVKLPAAALEPETALVTLKRLRKELARISFELDQTIEALE